MSAHGLKGCIVRCYPAYAEFLIANGAGLLKNFFLPPGGPIAEMALFGNTDKSLNDRPLAATAAVLPANSGNQVERVTKGRHK